MSNEHSPLPRTILVADDEIFVLNVVELTLERANCVVLKASSGREALEIARSFEGEIDLILSDLKMPGMNGIELLKILERERPRTRALLMTGESSGSGLDVDMAKLEVIYKPFLPNELVHRIRAILDGAAQLRKPVQGAGVGCGNIRALPGTY